MDYSLAIENSPETVSGGTGILLLHPSTDETDTIDTQFLQTDTDGILVISTHTPAPEVREKLEHYGVDTSVATIVDTLSVERGYTRRKSDDVRYVSAPDDLDAVVEHTEDFLRSTDGERRVSLDSITEQIYYADVERSLDAVEALLDLLAEHDAIGLFHLAKEVHDDEVVERFADRFDLVLELEADGSVTRNP